MINEVFRVNAPNGSPIELALKISAPRPDPSGGWLVTFDCPQIPDATGQMQSRTSLGAVQGAISLIATSMEDELSKGYTHEKFGSAVNYIRDAFDLPWLDLPTSPRETPPDYDFLLITIKQLTKRLPGVKEAQCYYTRGLFCLQFVCTNGAALIQLLSIQESTAIPISLTRPWESMPDATNGKPFAFGFEIEICDDPSDSHTKCEVFIMYLVSHLFYLNRLPRNEAEAILKIVRADINAFLDDGPSDE